MKKLKPTNLYGEDLLTLEEANEMALSPQTVRNYVAAGVLKAVRHGGKMMFQVEAIDEYFKKPPIWPSKKAA